MFDCYYYSTTKSCDSSSFYWLKTCEGASYSWQHQSLVASLFSGPAAFILVYMLPSNWLLLQLYFIIIISTSKILGEGHSHKLIDHHPHNSKISSFLDLNLPLIIRTRNLKYAIHSYHFPYKILHEFYKIQTWKLMTIH